jgi:hypothetical protein
MTTESIIHATCTRIREAKGLPECLQCPERETWGEAGEVHDGEPLCHSIARAAWDKETEND